MTSLKRKILCLQGQHNSNLNLTIVVKSEPCIELRGMVSVHYGFITTGTVVSGTGWDVPLHSVSNANNYYGSCVLSQSMK